MEPRDDFSFEDPLLPDVRLYFHELSRGTEDDDELIREEVLSRKYSDYGTLHILGVKPHPLARQKYEFETGKANLFHMTTEARLKRQLCMRTAGDCDAEDPPPYNALEEDIFQRMNFAPLRGVVAFLRHDVGEVVLRKDWSEEVLRNDIVVTAVYPARASSGGASEATGGEDRLPPRPQASGEARSEGVVSSSTNLDAEKAADEVEPSGIKWMRRILRSAFGFRRSDECLAQPIIEEEEEADDAVPPLRPKCSRYANPAIYLKDLGPDVTYSTSPRGEISARRYKP